MSAHWTHAKDLCANLERPDFLHRLKLSARGEAESQNLQQLTSGLVPSPWVPPWVPKWVSRIPAVHAGIAGLSLQTKVQASRLYAFSPPTQIFVGIPFPNPLPQMGVRGLNEYQNSSQVGGEGTNRILKVTAHCPLPTAH